jgi:hypothetical protein
MIAMFLIENKSGHFLKETKIIFLKKLQPAFSRVRYQYPVILARGKMFFPCPLLWGLSPVSWLTKMLRTANG